jgi:hypothetical protein
LVTTSRLRTAERLAQAKDTGEGELLGDGWGIRSPQNTATRPQSGGGVLSAISRQTCGALVVGLHGDAPVGLSWWDSMEMQIIIACERVAPTQSMDKGTKELVLVWYFHRRS